MTSTEGFKRHGDHSYIAQFADSEKEVLLNLCEQIIELLAERTDHGHDDPLAAMVGITSHDSPPMRIHLKSSDDGTVDLDHESANAWLGAINDIRLALGVRLKVENSSHEELELLAPDDPLRGVYAVYTWLGWLQETLLSSLIDDADEDEEAQLGNS
jgi:hypothetical protein